MSVYRLPGVHEPLHAVAKMICGVGRSNSNDQL